VSPESGSAKSGESSRYESPVRIKLAKSPSLHRRLIDQIILPNALITSDRRSKIFNVIRVSSGNFLEMYDFIVFGYYASAIGAAYFPSGSKFVTLMNTFMTFGAGFLMRPVGAIVLGAYIDKVGRRAGLILSLGLMSIGTLLIACLPGFATIGFFAPLLILISRLIQGLSAGVELGGVSVYLAEIATPGHKGFYVSWQSASQQVAVVLSAALGVALHSFIPEAAMNNWGWRVPFFIGCLIIPLLFLLRRSLPETDEFLKRKERLTTSQILRILAGNWRLVLIGLMMVTMTTVSFYLITAYTPTFGTRELHLSETNSLIVTLFVGLSNFIWLPLMGALSDRIGRRPILIACTVLALATAFPAMRWLASVPSFSRLLTVELWLSFIYGSYNGAMVVLLAEIMPIQVRAAGFSLAYSLATAIFGGFTPAICTNLINATNDKAMPGLWMSFAALLGLIAALMVRDKDRSWGWRANGQEAE
jgi:MHS family citrate/tricarballylate:H+ symporter-like MFS transporter